MRHHLLETGFIISSKPASASETASFQVLFFLNEEEELVCEDFSKVVGKKKKKKERRRGRVRKRQRGKG